MSYVFISYASEDVEAARKLYRDLEAKGYQPWLDKENILAGARWEIEIRKAIQNSRYVILILSKHSMGKRGFIQREVRYALKVHDEFPDNARFLIPVRIELCEVINPELKALHWLDLFPSYEDGLRKLLLALGDAQAAEPQKWEPETQQRTAAAEPPDTNNLAKASSAESAAAGEFKDLPATEKATIVKSIVLAVVLISLGFAFQQLDNQREPPDAIPGVDPRNVLVADQGLARRTIFVESRTGRTIATIDGTYEGTEVDDPAKIIISGRDPETEGRFASYGVHDMRRGKTRWMTPQPSGLFKDLDGLAGVAPDWRRGLFFRNNDVWIADLNWDNFQIRNPRQVTKAGVFGGSDEIGWVSGGIIFLGIFRIDLANGAVTEPFGTEHPLSLQFSPNNRYALFIKGDPGDLYLYDAVRDVTQGPLKLPKGERQYSEMFSWVGNDEILWIEDADPYDGRCDFWRVNVLNGRKSHILKVARNMESYKFYDVRDNFLIVDGLLVDIRTGKRFRVEPLSVVSPFGSGRFVLGARNDGALKEKGTWVIDFEAGRKKRVTPYIAQQAVALDSQRLVFFVANNELHRLKFNDDVAENLHTAVIGLFRPVRFIDLP